MDITPLVAHDAQIIQSYKNGGFRISGVLYEEPVLVMPDQTLPWQGFSDLKHPSIDDFSSLWPQIDSCEVVLLGCGRGNLFLPPKLRAAFSSRSIVVEAMDSSAACRTYNVLLTEGRLVGAMLMPI